MLKLKYAKALALGICMSVLSTGVAFADTGAGQSSKPEGQLEVVTTTAAPDTVVSSQVSEIDESILNRQQGIDKMLFEQYADEIAKKGFMVTHTGPLDGYVEVGITPYSESNAEYLYGLIGKDMVKIVEGQMAVALDGAEVNGAVPVMAATTTSAKDSKASEGDSSLLFYALGAAVVLGAGAIVGKKKLAATKK